MILDPFKNNGTCWESTLIVNWIKAHSTHKNNYCTQDQHPHNHRTIRNWNQRYSIHHLKETVNLLCRIYCEFCEILLYYIEVFNTDLMVILVYIYVSFFVLKVELIIILLCFCTWRWLKSPQDLAFLFLTVRLNRLWHQPLVQHSCWTAFLPILKWQAWTWQEASFWRANNWQHYWWVHVVKIVTQQITHLSMVLTQLRLQEHPQQWQTWFI